MSKQNHILIVDDVEINRQMLIRIFSSDYTVHVAANGQEALQELTKYEIAVVLLDLIMPEMDGYEVIRAMKSRRELASIPILVTTAVGDKSERLALDLGADDFIAKPYDPYVVRKRVENFIQKQVLQLNSLRQALEQAAELSKAKSAFLSRMSDELREPLNTIIALAQAQKEQAQDAAAVSDYSKKIVASSEQLLSVINDVLDVHAIENQEIKLTPSSFNFRRLMETIAARFYSRCKEKELTFSLTFTNFTEEYLFGDAQHLEKILSNLIANAVKFTPEGGKIAVQVQELSRIADRVKLRFEVIDNGEGIEAERQTQIFQPFTQENINAVRRYGSRGLGLNIVRQLVELMGGQVSVQSDKGEGSSFIVDLPILLAQDRPALATTSSGKSSEK